MVIALLRRYQIVLVVSAFCLFVSLDGYGQSPTPATPEVEVDDADEEEDVESGILVLGKELLLETGKRLNLVSEEEYEAKSGEEKKKVRFTLFGITFERK